MTGLGPLRLGSGQTAPPALFRVYLLVGAVMLALSLLLYFNSLARRVDAQAEAMSSLVAEVIGFTTLAVGELPDSLAQKQFENVIDALTFPMIVTDPTGRPLAWSRQVKEKPQSIETLIAADLNHPGPALKRILETVDRMDQKHRPVPMIDPGTTVAIAYLHYGSPALTRELKWTPWITIAVAMVFGLVGLLILRNIKRAEESFIWAGMAKESAHQMGTPLSSLAGWITLLREEAVAGEDPVLVKRSVFDEVVQEIEQDTGRLNRVAARFSQIGSKPKLVLTDIRPIAQSTVDYFKRRFPEGVILNLDISPDLPEVRLNPELFGWVLENLIKNAVNAVDPEAGQITVRVSSSSAGEILISVIDNGKGITPGMEKQIFRPGVSTRHRGWGLGLPLSRRIVEQYHGGRLELVRSEPGQTTEFRVTLLP